MDRLNKNNPFKVPDGYFDSFTGNILKRTAGEENSVPSNEGFKIPEGYFETLNSKLLAQLENNRTEAMIIPLKSNKKYYYIAASVAAVILLFIFIPWNRNIVPPYSDVANSDIEQYFEFNDLELSSYDLAEILPVYDLDPNDILENRLDNENIIEYLDSHIEDLEELNMHNDD
ncbi:MAG: hypothetical protein R2814_16265 [Flavobacteriaceae bacterium]